MDQLMQYIFHIDTYLLSFVSNYGLWAYAVLFLIIFCETGLVIAPLLPGDSLLFTAGSIAAKDGHILDIRVLFLILIIASILGNKTNYLIGRAIGPKIFKTKTSRWFNIKHLEDAHAFYEKHGGKTIILARYLPIIRTFVPFVAGISFMNLRQFTFYNIVSAVLWIGALLFAGYYFGSLPFIKDNFSIVIYGIIAISLFPPIFAFSYRKMFLKS